MTNKEAVETIEYARAFNEKNTPLMKALDMAISALQEREEQSKGCPCDLCQYNPPSSMGGKPCAMCPACAADC